VLVGRVEERLKQIAHTVSVEHGCELLEMEVMPDHVHLLVEIPPARSVSEFVGRLKGSSSFELRREFPALKSRLPTLWTNSFFCTTVGGAPLEIVKQYVANQKHA
jgi:putative transposase